MMASAGDNGRGWGSAQVSRDHYFTSNYLSLSRFRGLHAQLDACLATDEDETILEIGPGPGMLASLLLHFNRNVQTVDFSFDVGPDVLGRLPTLPYSSNSFDIVCAFEILEHQPLELLKVCLGEIARIARRRVLISVPDQTELNDGIFGIQVMFGTRSGGFAWPMRLNRLTNPKEHYWEIGHAGVSAETVIEMGERQGLTPISSHFAKPWFHMFIFDIAPDTEVRRTPRSEITVLPGPRTSTDN